MADTDTPSEHIPLEPEDEKPTDTQSPINRIVRAAKEAAERCPKCGADMSNEDAVVCVECGYDLVRNKLRSVNVAIDEVEEESDLCQPDRFGWRAPLAIGLVALAAAAIIIGISAQGPWGRDVLRVLLYGPIQIGLGVVAVLGTARLLEVRVGALEFGAARVALAVGLAYLAFHIIDTQVSAAPGVVLALGWFLAAAVYYAAVWLTFRLAPIGAAMLGGLHVAMWFVFKVSIFIINWIEQAPPPPAAN